MHWKLSQPNLPVNSGQIVDWLLENRDITKKSEFLKPRQPIQYLAAEVGINQVELVKAAARIRLAIQNKQRVIIFGDYDVDGVSATAILWEAIKVAGLITQPFIPHRINHGYGLSLKALTEIFNQDNDSQKSKPDLIITVDNGIVAYEALEFLKNLGVEVIVTDHHQPDTKLLPVLATVHTTHLSGAGVAWFLARELCPEVSDQWLDLVTIATIADQMPVLAANRAFIVAGLKILNQRVARPGLKALFKVAEVDPKNLTAEQLSFSLIPRLNAMGRVADGIDALRMLCIKSADKAEALAAKLQVTNLARQELTLELMKEADQQAKSQQKQKIIIVTSPNFHEGVIGLLAGKLMEKFHKPVIAIQVGPVSAKASARSLPGINIVAFLRENRSLFLEMGGHKLAAGFVCESARVVEVVAELIKSAAKTILPEQLADELAVDCQLPSQMINLKVFDEINQLQPFGQGNPKPIFLIRNVTLAQIDVIGKNNQHLRLKLGLSKQELITALAWQKAVWLTQLKIGQSLEIIVQLDLNIWQNRRQLQLSLIDWH